MSAVMDRAPSQQKSRFRWLRREVLWGALLLAAAAYFSYGPLPEDGDEPKPAPLERLWFRLTDSPAPRGPDVIFVPTPQAAVDRMLELAELKPGDVLYDLGCGDGRFVINAAKKYGVRAVGVDIDTLRVAESLRNVKANGVENLVTIIHGDIFELDFSEATVVTLYLLPELNVRLMPKLAQLRPGTRILSFDFDMRGAKPEVAEQIHQSHSEDSRMHYPRWIFKWTVPWEPE
jgi:SAM-dependent methyltransferase